MSDPAQYPPSGNSLFRSILTNLKTRRLKLQVFEDRRLRWLLSFASIVAIALSWSMMHEMQLIANQPLTSWAEDQSADCGIVLTGGPNRIREGLELLSRRAVLKLIISGVNPQTELRQIFSQMPYFGDFNEKDVILERRSRTTFGNAQQSNPLVEALRCRDVILITSRAHMYRAMRTFRAEFPPSITILARAVASQTAEPSQSEIVLEAAKSLFYGLWAYSAIHAPLWQPIWTVVALRLSVVSSDR